MATRFIDKVPNLATIVNRPDAAGIGMYNGGVYANLSGTPFLIAANPAGKIYYVDANSGDDTDDGRSWEDAFSTMSKAFTSVASGDTIYFRGKVREQLTSPAQVFDVTVIGEGNRPRHADNAPANGELAANTWTTPASGATTAPLVIVQQQGWRFVNILFAGPSDHSCVQLYRDTGSGDSERDGSHAEFIGCRFASGQDGIEQSGGCGHVGIYDCFFTGLTGVALKHTIGAGAGFPIRWEIVGNRFNSCPSIMTAVAAQDYRIQENTFMFASGPTLVFDFTSGARNAVIRNVFNIAAADFDPAGTVTGSGATDVWSNTLTDAIETGLPAN